MNHFRERTSMSDLWTIDYTGWQEGLKSLSYYVYTQPRSGGRKMGVRLTKEEEDKDTSRAMQALFSDDPKATDDAPASGGAGRKLPVVPVEGATGGRLSGPESGIKREIHRFGGAATFDLKCDPSDKDCAACAL